MHSLAGLANKETPRQLSWTVARSRVAVPEFLSRSRERLPSLVSAQGVQAPLPEVPCHYPSHARVDQFEMGQRGDERAPLSCPIFLLLILNSRWAQTPINE